MEAPQHGDVESWKGGFLTKVERAFLGSDRQGPTSTPPARNTGTPPGWYDDRSSGLRYWDGQRWTSQRAPSPNFEPMTKAILWAMSLASGVAGVLGWAAPVIAFYWPLGLGGASLAFAIAARELRGRTPWYGVIALITALVAVGIGIVGYFDIEDARTALDEFP
jgi:hypothetical protein